MSIKIEIDPERVITKQIDSRGRFTIGSEYKNKQVTVVVSDVQDVDDE